MPRKTPIHTLVVSNRDRERIGELARLRGQSMTAVLARIINAYFDDIMRREVQPDMEEWRE